MAVRAGSPACWMLRVPLSGHAGLPRATAVETSGGRAGVWSAPAREQEGCGRGQGAGQLVGQLVEEALWQRGAELLVLAGVQLDKAPVLLSHPCLFSGAQGIRTERGWALGPSLCLLCLQFLPICTVNEPREQLSCAAAPTPCSSPPSALRGTDLAGARTWGCAATRGIGR